MPGAVGGSLVVAHHTDATEADPLVRRDRADVVGRRIDGKTMVPAFGEQVTGQGADRIGAQALPVTLGSEENVDARMAVHRVVFLTELDRPDDLTVDLDREHLVVAIHQLVDVGSVEGTPTPGHLGLRQDRGETLGVVGGRWPQRDAIAGEEHARKPTRIS